MKLIFIVVVVALAIVASLTLDLTTLNTILTLVLLAQMLLVVPAGFYIWYVYRTRMFDAPFLTMLVKRDLLEWGSVIVILVLILLYLLHIELPRGVAATTTTACLSFFIRGILIDAIAFWRERHPRKPQEGTIDG